MNVILSLHLPRDAATVPTVRHLCALTLETLGADRGDIDDIALALTEACANVIDHAADGHDYDVELAVEGVACTITIRDRGGDEVPEVASQAVIDTDVSIEALPHRGRGITLMAALMDTLSFSPIDGGTSVELKKSLTVRGDSALQLLTST